MLNTHVWCEWMNEFLMHPKFYPASIVYHSLYLVYGHHTLHIVDLKNSSLTLRMDLILWNSILLALIFLSWPLGGYCGLTPSTPQGQHPYHDRHWEFLLLMSLNFILPRQFFLSFRNSLDLDVPGFRGGLQLAVGWCRETKALLLWCNSGQLQRHVPAAPQRINRGFHCNCMYIVAQVSLLPKSTFLTSSSIKLLLEISIQNLFPGNTIENSYVGICDKLYNLLANAYHEGIFSIFINWLSSAVSCAMQVWTPTKYQKDYSSCLQSLK